MKADQARSNAVSPDSLPNSRPVGPAFADASPRRLVAKKGHPMDFKFSVCNELSTVTNLHGLARSLEDELRDEFVTRRHAGWIA